MSESINGKRWSITPADPDAERDLARALGLSPLLARLLLNRGVRDVEAARTFLHPKLDHLHDPWQIPDIHRAADRIREAAQRGEKIVVYGDYDADGITATAILLECLALAGARAEFYMPDRIEEGYGLNLEAIRSFKEQRVDLVITVDCGINAVAEAELARESGIDLIVTDHHQPHREFSSAPYVVHSKLPDSRYPFPDLSGAGVAFKLAWAVAKSFSPSKRVSAEFREFLVDAVSLAALGTIADVVPLLGENRVIAHFGLEALRHSQRPGIRALCHVARVGNGALNAYDVAFRLAPRLNAAGRMGSARRAVELLSTHSMPDARKIAADLDRENARRQRVQQQILDEAHKVIESEGGTGDKPALVVAAQGWHPGVVGIIAGRLADRFYRPTIVIGIEDGVGHGSARSIPGVNIFEALQQCAERLTAFGGHAQAAGVRLREENLTPFREAFMRAVDAQLTDEAKIPCLNIDAEVPLASVAGGLVHELKPLAPHGEANPRPLLATRDLTIAGEVRRMGSRGQHISFIVRQGDHSLRAVAFGMGTHAQTLEERRTCSLAYTPQLNNWHGKTTVELAVKDIRLD